MHFWFHKSLGCQFFSFHTNQVPIMKKCPNCGSADIVGFLPDDIAGPVDDSLQAVGDWEDWKPETPVIITSFECRVCSFGWTELD